MSGVLILGEQVMVGVRGDDVPPARFLIRLHDGDVVTRTVIGLVMQPGQPA